MKNWTIAKRITAGGATLLILLLVVSIIAVTTLSRLQTFAGEKLRDDAIPGIVHSAEITAQSLRGYIRLLMAQDASGAEDLKQDVARSDGNVAKTDEAMDRYQKAIAAEDDRQNFAELKTRRDAFYAVRAQFIALLKEGNVPAAKAFNHAKLEPAYLAFREQIEKVQQWNEAAAVSVANQMVATCRSAEVITSVVAGVSILVAFLVGWMIIRSTNHALQTMATVLDDASTQVAAAAQQVSSSSHALAEGSSEQAASLEESSSSLEELASMTQRNADSAQAAKNISGETRTAADAGNSDMHEMRKAMDAIQNSSHDIAQIIKTIDEIAFQTNILALNAAVEAARAGESGAGFAVVADEVRALAQRSANSAKESANRIEVAMQNSQQGVQISEKVAQSLGVIVEKAGKVDGLVAEIATASNEQSQGIGQISSAVSQMDTVTQSNAANAEETASAAEELSKQSQTLKDAVSDLRRLVGGRRGEVNTIASSSDAPPTVRTIPHQSAVLRNSVG
ncbi:MAG: methyl-accepting chemotaxis protein [Nibricoccus sp.]